MQVQHERFVSANAVLTLPQNSLKRIGGHGPTTTLEGGGCISSVYKQLVSQLVRASICYTHCKGGIIKHTIFICSSAIIYNVPPNRLDCLRPLMFRAPCFICSSFLAIQQAIRKCRLLHGHLSLTTTTPTTIIRLLVRLTSSFSNELHIPYTTAIRKDQFCPFRRHQH